MAKTDLGGFINSIAKQLFAMESKKHGDISLDRLRNERYQRTMTDEYDKYPWLKNTSRGRFKPVDPEQKAFWEMSMRRGEK